MPCLEFFKLQTRATTCVFDERVVAGVRATVDYECYEEKLGVLHLNGIFTVPTTSVMIL